MNNFLQVYDKSIRLKPNGFSLLQRVSENHWLQKNVTLPLSVDTSDELKFFHDGCGDTITVIPNIHVPVLIPKTLFDETAKEDYINLNYEIEEPVFVFEEELDEYRLLHFINESQKIVLEQSGYLLQWFHLSGLLHKELRQSERYHHRKSCFSLYVEENFIDFIFEKEGKLQIMNRFEYTSSFDILYYILNIAKQFQLAQTEISIISYNLQDEETIGLLKQYIGEVQVIVGQ